MDKYLPCVQRLIFIIALLLIWISGARSQVILSPLQDVYVITFGGGEGCNAFLRYDISAVPAGAVIDSVFLSPFCWSVGPAWDGDVDYWNVNDQTWTETDSCSHIWSLPTSDSTYQPAGFATVVGWTRSVDLANIVLVDYNAGHQYCSIKIKDHDDMTSVPMPGSMPVNSNDTLAIGNIIFNQHVLLYPREYPNAPPRLTIFYHSVGSDEYLSQNIQSSAAIVPNPCRDNMTVTGWCDNGKYVSVRVYDCTGKEVRALPATVFETGTYAVEWNCLDQQGRKVSPGCYFLRITAGETKVTKKVAVLR